MFISPAFLLIPFFQTAVTLGFFGTFMIYLPLCISPIGIIIFKLYFEGTRINLAQIILSENKTDKVLLMKKLQTNTLRMVLFTSLIFVIININNFLFYLVNFTRPLSVNLTDLFLNGAFYPKPGILYASYLPVFITCCIILAALHKKFIPKFVLIHKDNKA